MKQIPKDRQIIITTNKGTQVGRWSEADKMFAVANVQVDTFEGVMNMHYYETEYVKEENIISWREL